MSKQDDTINPKSRFLTLASFSLNAFVEPAELPDELRLEIIDLVNMSVDGVVHEIGQKFGVNLSVRLHPDSYE